MLFWHVNSLKVCCQNDSHSWLLVGGESIHSNMKHAWPLPCMLQPTCMVSVSNKHTWIGSSSAPLLARLQWQGTSLLRPAACHICCTHAI